MYVDNVAKYKDTNTHTPFAIQTFSLKMQLKLN